MSIKIDGDLLLTKACSVINMCMFVIFSVLMSVFIVHFHPLFPPFSPGRRCIVFSVSFRKEQYL